MTGGEDAMQAPGGGCDRADSHLLIVDLPNSEFLSADPTSIVLSIDSDEVHSVKPRQVDAPRILNAPPASLRDYDWVEQIKDLDLALEQRKDLDLTFELIKDLGLIYGRRRQQSERAEALEAEQPGGGPEEVDSHVLIVDLPNSEFLSTEPTSIVLSIDSDEVHSVNPRQAGAPRIMNAPPASLRDYDWVEQITDLDLMYGRERQEPVCADAGDGATHVEAGADTTHRRRCATAAVLLVGLAGAGVALELVPVPSGKDVVRAAQTSLRVAGEAADESVEGLAISLRAVEDLHRDSPEFRGVVILSSLAPVIGWAASTIRRGS